MPTCFNCSNPVDAKTIFCPYCDAAISTKRDRSRSGKTSPGDLHAAKQRLWPLTLAQLTFVILGFLTIKVGVQVYHRLVILPSVTNALEAKVLGDEPPMIATALPWLALPVMMILARNGASLFYRIGRTKRQIKRDIKAAILLEQLKQGSQEHFSLYLRSFSQEGDLKREKGFWWHIMIEGDILAIDRETLDLMISSEMRRTYPVIALDQEGEKLGAGRLSSADADWEDLVLLLMKQAKAIFIVPGTSQGVIWEVEQLRNYHNKTVYIMPPAKYWQGEVEQQWDTTQKEYITRGIFFPSYRKTGALFRLNEHGRVVESSPFQKRFGGSRVLQFVSLIETDPTTKLRRVGMSMISLVETANRLYKSLVPIALALLVTLSLARMQGRPSNTRNLLLTELATNQAYHLETVKYDKAGVSFFYPSTWKLQETQDDKAIDREIRTLVIESNDALVRIHLMQAGASLSLDTFANQTAAGRQASIKGFVRENKILYIQRNANGGVLDGIRHTFYVTQSSETTAYSQDFFEIRNKNTKVLITMCGSDIKWDYSERGFQVIFDSLKF